MPVFVHAQGIKIVHPGGGGGQNSVHIVVKCPLISSYLEAAFGLEKYYFFKD